MLVFSSIAAVVVGLFVLYLIWPRILRRIYRPERRFDDLLFTVTEDQRRLPLYHYRAKGPTRRRHPVILCPGLGSNRYSFDLGEKAPSLALTLAGAGFDVFVVELRGEGHGDHVTATWNFDDFVERDAPALVAAVRDATGAAEVYWVGHSMGGMVLLSAVARGIEHVRAGVTLGSALAFHGTDHGLGDYDRMRPIAELLEEVPYGWISQIVAPFAARRFRNPLDELNLNVDNCRPADVRRLDAIGFTAISSDVALQLATAIEPGGLRPVGEDEAPYIEQLAARSDPPPIMLMHGEGDPQCPDEAMQRVVRTHAEFIGRTIGPSTGAQMAYGHFDMLMGSRADVEVFPHVLDWLARHDAPADDAPAT